MPMYAFKCGTCGAEFDESRMVSSRDFPAACPCGGIAGRDVIASMHPHTDTGYQKEILSDALGVHASQVAEAQQRFPHHRFAPDGRMLIGSHTERKRVMKDLGFFDRDGY